ncbi:hypothetical protein FA15DRAFT_674490 [Coprinopsis marcescibilis]|uniref:Actin-like ATPase domain-containing protein n=1 Tax=Coprinopsis marcescibilis TaxID=230819 RepID=A0A5C3KU44_COPMA|nr:hypothetical protein FA15DRAFT_674490 [Coprinopsis marcescibilis]
MRARSAYAGPRRKLLLAFDVGTTYSGISYSILDPGQVPEIKGVTKYPAQDHISGASKIPSLIYYNKDGKVVAVGAEAKCEGIAEQASESSWSRAEWFKLHLRPKSQKSTEFTGQVPPLPHGKTVVNILADFLRYLLQCASNYIQETHPNGSELWKQVKDDIHYVLSHPNGWEGFQRQEMRDASVIAGLVPDRVAAHSRITFVTEGEASLHFAIHNGLPPGAIQNQEGVVIVDAGGGTIDFSAYASVGGPSAAEPSFEEIAVPQCHLHGSLSVTFNARDFLEAFLSESDFLEDLDHIIDCFDKTTKLRFRNNQESQYIKFGSTRDNDPHCNIRIGQLKLEGSDVALFFAPSVRCVVSAVLEQRKTCHKPISHVVLVGGFSASDWLFHQVSQALTPKGLNVIRPDSHVNKAVSDGAISFYLDHFVRTRVAKFTYGQFCTLKYNPQDPEHAQRSSDVFTSYAGEQRLSGSFDVILKKNTQIHETKEFREDYCRKSVDKAFFKSVPFRIFCYRGKNPNPKWQSDEPDKYTLLCTIEMDFSHLNLPLRYGTQGSSVSAYYQLDYGVIISFGLTELKAQIAWEESGKEHRSPAKIIYDPDITQSSGR